MDPVSLAKSDVFFVVTTVSVVLVTIVIVVGGIYVIEILRAVRRISRIAEQATEDVSEDIQGLRADIKRNGVSLGAFLNFFHNFGKKQQKKK